MCLSSSVRTVSGAECKREKMNSEKKYSLNNTYYPLTSLDSELERLFGSPVYFEHKMVMYKNEMLRKGT